MSSISGGDFRYKAQVNIGSVIVGGKGWLNEDEICLISRENLWNINDVVRFGRKCDFRHERITDTYWTIRWFYLPQSYLFEMTAKNAEDFGVLCDQFERYLNYLKTVVYPSYRKSDEFIEWT